MVSMERLLKLAESEVIIPDEYLYTDIHRLLAKGLGNVKPELIKSFAKIIMGLSEVNNGIENLLEYKDKQILKLLIKNFHELIAKKNVNALEDTLDIIHIIAETSDIGGKECAQLITTLVTLVLDEDTWSFPCYLESAKLSNLLLEIQGAAPTEIKESAPCQKLVMEFGRLLRESGDYELQATLMEALFRLVDETEKRAKLPTWFPSEQIQNSFLSIRNEEFETDCRQFLNTFNSHDREIQKVFSYPVDYISLGRYQLQRPRDSKVTEFWTDFNLRSLSISAFVNDDSATEANSQWEMVCIKKDVVRDFRFNVTEENLVLILKLSEPASEMAPFCPFAPENYIKIVAQKNSEITIAMEKMFGCVKYVEFPAPSPITSSEKKRTQGGKVSMVAHPLNLVHHGKNTPNSTPDEKAKNDLKIDFVRTVQTKKEPNVVSAIEPNRKIVISDEELVVCDDEKPVDTMEVDNLELKSAQDEKSRDDSDVEIVQESIDIQETRRDEVKVAASPDLKVVESVGVAQAVNVNEERIAMDVDEEEEKKLMETLKGKTKADLTKEAPPVELAKEPKELKTTKNSKRGKRTSDESRKGKKLLSVQPVVFQDSPDELYQPMPVKDPFENPDWKRKSKEGAFGTLKKSKLVGVEKTDDMYEFDEGEHPDTEVHEEKVEVKVKEEKAATGGKKKKTGTQKSKKKGKHEDAKTSKCALESEIDNVEYHAKEEVDEGHEPRRSRRTKAQVVNYEESRMEEDEDEKEHDTNGRKSVSFESPVCETSYFNAENSASSPEEKDKENAMDDPEQGDGLQGEYKEAEEMETEEAACNVEMEEEKPAGDSPSKMLAEVCKVVMKVEKDKKKKNPKASKKMKEPLALQLTNNASKKLLKKPFEKNIHCGWGKKVHPPSLLSTFDFVEECSTESGRGKTSTITKISEQTGWTEQKVKKQRIKKEYKVTKGSKQVQSIIDIAQNSDVTSMDEREEIQTKKYLKKKTKAIRCESQTITKSHEISFTEKTVVSRDQEGDQALLENNSDVLADSQESIPNVDVKQLKFSDENGSSSQDSEPSLGKQKKACLFYGGKKKKENKKVRIKSKKCEKEQSRKKKYVKRRQLCEMVGLSSSQESQDESKKSQQRRKKNTKGRASSSSSSDSGHDGPANKETCKELIRKIENKDERVSRKRSSPKSRKKEQTKIYDYAKEVETTSNDDNDGLMDVSHVDSVTSKSPEPLIKYQADYEQICDYDATEDMVVAKKKMKKERKTSVETDSCGIELALKAEQLVSGIFSAKKAEKQESVSHEESNTHMEVEKSVSGVSKSSKTKMEIDSQDTDIQSSNKSDVTSVDASQEQMMIIETPANRKAGEKKTSMRKSLDQMFENIESVANQKQLRRKLWKSPVVVMNDVFIDNQVNKTSTVKSLTTRESYKEVKSGRQTSATQCKQSIKESHKESHTKVTEGNGKGKLSVQTKEMTKEICTKSEESKENCFGKFLKGMLEHSAAAMNPMNDEVHPVNTVDTTIPSSMESSTSTNNEELPSREVHIHQSQCTSTSTQMSVEKVSYSIPPSDEAVANTSGDFVNWQKVDDIVSSSDNTEFDDVFTSYCNTNTAENMVVEGTELQPMIASFKNNVAKSLGRKKDLLDKFVQKVTKMTANKMQSTWSNQHQQRKSVDASFSHECCDQLDQWHAACDEKEKKMMVILDKLKETLKEGTKGEKSSISKLKSIHKSHLEEKEKLYVQEKEGQKKAEDDLRLEIKKMKDAMMDESKSREMTKIRNALKTMLVTV